MKKIIAVILMLSVGILYIFPVSAADRVIRNHSFNVEDIKELEINNSVGSIEMRISDDDELHVEGCMPCKFCAGALRFDAAAS